MPKRDIEEFIAHWSGATAPAQAISQKFLCGLWDLLEVPQPGNQRNVGYTFEFHVRECGTRSGRKARGHSLVASRLPEWREKAAESAHNHTCQVKTQSQTRLAESDGRAGASGPDRPARRRQTFHAIQFGQTTRPGQTRRRRRNPENPRNPGPRTPSEGGGFRAYGAFIFGHGN